VDKVEGELQGQLRRGLLYFPLDSQGEKAGNPVKASLFGKIAEIDALEKHFTVCKNKSNDQLLKQNLKRSITEALHSSKNEQAFKKKLKKIGIDTVVRKNDNGRIYGITFIDHHSKTVWNGSRLGKEISANAFNDYWNKKIKPVIKHPFESQSKISKSKDADIHPKEPHDVFKFLNTSEKYQKGFIVTLGGMIPESQGEDYEEQDFVNKMKKKRKRRRE
jgi:hypothetical protein